MACETCRLLKELLESAGVTPEVAGPVNKLAEPTERKVKRKASDYSKRYGRNFKRIAGKYISNPELGLRTDSNVLSEKLTDLPRKRNKF